MENWLFESIDILLMECKNKGFISWSSSDSKKEIEAIRTSKTLELITNKSDNSFELTKLGLEVISFGGYKKYVEKTESEKGKDAEMKKLTIKELKGNIFQLKYWWLILLVNLILSGIISCFIIILSRQK